MKYLALAAILLTTNLICKAQEEIIFNDPNIDKSEIKVTKSLQGIEFSTDFIRFLPDGQGRLAFSSIKTQVNYFHEHQIANTWTLNLSSGLGNIVNHSNYTSSITTSPLKPSNYSYLLSLNLKLEPRWYFDQRLRYRHNKSTRYNTGWYLSIPLLVTSNILTQGTGLPNTFGIKVITPPTIGYRNSFAKNWFLEANIGIIPATLIFENMPKGLGFEPGLKTQLRTLKSNNIFSAGSYNSELKISYVF